MRLGHQEAVLGLKGFAPAIGRIVGLGMAHHDGCFMQCRIVAIGDLLHIRFAEGQRAAVFGNVRAGFEDLQGGGGLVHAASFPASEHAVFETGFQLSRAATDWFMSPVFPQCRLTHWDRILQETSNRDGRSACSDLVARMQAPTWPSEACQTPSSRR